MCLKLTNQWRLDKIKQELCLGMPMKLAILFLLINMLSTHQANCFWVMEERQHTISFMMVHCFMMQILVLFGQIKSLLELMKLWWQKNALNNSYVNWLLLKFDICIVIIRFSMLKSSWKIARTTSRLSHFLELVPIIKMPLLNGQFKPSCTWPETSWFMCLYIGANMKLIILLCEVLLWKILFGFKITFPTISLVWHHLNYWLRPRLIIVTFCILMFGDAQSMSLILSYWMGGRFQNGIVDHVWANSWVLVIHILP